MILTKNILIIYVPGLIPHNLPNPIGQIVPDISKYCSLHTPLSGDSISVSTKSTLS